MSRIRSIHPGLYTDEAYVSLSMAARVLLPGLWTECDDHGVFEWKPVTLKMKIFPADNVDVGALLAELLNVDAVKRFTHDGKEYGVARNFRKYQRPKNPSYRYTLPDEYRNYIGLDCDPTPAAGEASPSPTEKSPQMEDGGGRGEKKKDSRAVAKATRPARDEKFEEFWKSYPRRKGANPKKPAKDLWLAAIKRGVEPNEIIAAVKAGTGFDRDKIGTEFIPQAVKWLRDQRYGDYERVEENQARAGFYAGFNSPELVSWAAYERAGGTKYPRDKRGGWEFPTRWPPGHAPPGEGPGSPGVSISA